jgi:hypothetical protein
LVIVSIIFLLLAVPFGPRCCWCVLSVPHRDFYSFHHPLRFRAYQIDCEKPVFKAGAVDLHAFCQQEDPLELPRGDAAMEKVSLRSLALSTANDELALLDEDFELILCETGNSQRDPQALWRGLRACHPLDIVGRIAIACGASGPLHSPLDFIEAEQERRIQ